MQNLPWCLCSSRGKPVIEAVIVVPDRSNPCYRFEDELLRVIVKLSPYPFGCMFDARLRPSISQDGASSSSKLLVILNVFCSEERPVIKVSLHRTRRTALKTSSLANAPNTTSDTRQVLVDSARGILRRKTGLKATTYLRFKAKGSIAQVISRLTSCHPHRSSNEEPDLTAVAVGVV